MLLMTFVRWLLRVTRTLRRPAWHDPTYGRIDSDIQAHVTRMDPSSLAQQVAIENTLQEQRNRAR